MDRLISYPLQQVNLLCKSNAVRVNSYGNESDSTILHNIMKVIYKKDADYHGFYLVEGTSYDVVCDIEVKDRFGNPLEVYGLSHNGVAFADTSKTRPTLYLFCKKAPNGKELFEIA